MSTIDLETAVREIVHSTLSRTPYPFFFIVGAGISASSVPIASRIIDECVQLAQQRKLQMPPLPTDPMERYEKALLAVHPNPADRQQYLHALINDKPISPANLRLAHLLESRKLTNLVLTPNFDEMLTKALRLFGAECVVCDHPQTTRRVNPNEAGLLQVVHVHGTHWFYDCVNLKGEIKGRAKRDDVSMFALIDHILAQRSPILVGYSGWSDDVIMTALKKWLKQPSHPHHLYWFCYRASEAEQVRKLTKNHASVRIVVDENEPLDATRVFEEMIRALDLPSPAITRDPLSFFAKQLEHNLGTVHDRNDIYLMAQVIARVKRGVELEAAEFEQLTAKQKANAEVIAKLGDAVRRGAFAEAMAQAKNVSIEPLTEEQRKQVIAALQSLFDSYAAREPEAIVDMTQILCAVAAETSDEAFARYAHAWALDAVRPSDDSLAAQSTFLAKFRDAKDSDIRSYVAKTLSDRARTLAELDRKEDAAATWAELRSLFGDDPEHTGILEVASINEIVYSGASPEERLVALQHFARNADHPYLLAQALAGQVSYLEMLKRHQELIAVADEYLSSYANDMPAPLNAKTLVSKALAHLELGQRDEAVATLDLVEQRHPGHRTEAIAALREKLAAN